MENIDIYKQGNGPIFPTFNHHSEQINTKPFSQVSSHGHRDHDVSDGGKFALRRQAFFFQSALELSIRYGQGGVGHRAIAGDCAWMK